MELLTTVFRQLLSMALTALPVMAVVMLARLVLRRAPRKYSYGLWAVVGLRLVCPWSLSQAAWSLFNLPLLRRAAEAAGSDVSTGLFAAPYAAPPAAGTVQAAPPALGGGAVAEAARTGLSGGELALEIAAVLWLAGVLALAAYAAVSTVRLRRRVSAAVWQGGGVWTCDAISGPFVLGVFRPRIYLPVHLEEGERTYVLAHERYHLRRRDHWVKPLAFLLLAVYWWNPAAWLCWALLCRDMEMSCDEAVLTELGGEAKRGYSLSLVSFATERRFPTASPLAFGEHDAKRRVKNVLRWRRETPRMAFLAFAAGLLVVMLCCFNAQEAESWVRVDHLGNGVRFTCDLRAPIRSWAIYEDVYEEGTLVSSRPCVSDGFREDGGGVSSRQFSGTLTAIVPSGQEGFAGEMHCAYGEFSWSVSLPKSAYTGMGSVGGSETDGLRQPLREDGEAVLLSILLSTEVEGGIRWMEDLPRSNDTVVQYRLVTSTDPVERFNVQDTAQTLFDLRTPYLGDAPAVGNLLSALEVGDLGDYSIELFTSAPPYTLQVNFKEEPGDIDPTSPATDAAMTVNTAVLLALIDNLEQVNWSYPSREDGQETLITQYLDRAQPDAWAQSLGYRDCKHLGETAAGIRALLAYLDDGASPAERLFASRYDTSALAEELLCRGPWGRPELENGYWLTEAAGTELRFDFTEPPAVPADFDAAMGRNALVLLDLRPAIDRIRWSYPAEGFAVEREFDRESDALMILALSSKTETTAQRPSQSAEDLQWLLDYAGSIDKGLFQSLSEMRSQGWTVSTEPFTGILGFDGVCVTETAGYGWSLRTYYALTADGGRTPIAESFGWGGPEDYAVDLDGDGTEEMVCTVIYNGDGAKRVEIYQQRADGVYRGWLDYRGELPADYVDWGVNSAWQEYDPSANVFRVYYDTGADGAEYAVWETRGLDHVVFERYAP